MVEKGRSNEPKIQSDPAQLRDRLNQPRTTLEEALRQLQTTIPLSPLGEKELEESDAPVAGPQGVRHAAC
jgi:hypothetical protein